ncbi:MAG: hypothetical protein EBR82_66560 [Caulobacteraceae bacterium]|nr:hypothetical protein [Caulobacteraceae bacterium]
MVLVVLHHPEKLAALAGQVVVVRLMETAAQRLLLLVGKVLLVVIPFMLALITALVAVAVRVVWVAQGQQLLAVLAALELPTHIKAMAQHQVSL